MTNRETLLWLLQQAGVPRRKLALLPDFLVVSPPKTGTTWLADNLRCHPGVFVPASKEVRYFSTFGDWAGLEWYLDHFAGAGGRLKGEASPSYALLPPERIRLLRDLVPDVKLVFLVREPVGRAWSHARHTFRYCEAGFAGRTLSLEEMAEEDWLAGFRHPWLAANDDCLGQLERWLGVFPREQVFLGFFEDLVRRPEGLLRDVFAFLGVDAGLPLGGFPVRERILEGMPAPLTPRLEGELRSALRARSAELSAFLRGLGLEPPPEWDWCREPADAAPPLAEFDA
ncbi:MAG: sulfotransferase domain-containing protein, partial [Gemmataceae bacterium]|nr:sulfotransferase domain-containing protein [Gemmataceae bacterium]